MVSFHSRWRVRRLAALLLTALGAANLAQAETTEFAAAKPALQQKLTRGKSSERVEAVSRLKHYSSPDAIKLLVQRGLKDRAPEVRTAAAEALWAYRESPTACLVLLESLRHETRKQTPDESLGPVLCVLLASSAPAIQHELTSVLDQWLLRDERGLSLLASATEQLRKQDEDLAVGALVKLTRLRAFDANFPLRRSLVRALALCNTREAVDCLVDLLSKTDGEVKADIAGRLTVMSQQAFALDSKAWAKWWKEKRTGFQFNAVDNTATWRPQIESVRGSYYGVPIHAKRIVFVMDISGSMEGPRSAAAKRELIRAIAALDEQTSFTVLAFNDLVFVWQKALQPATTMAKQNAAMWVDAQICEEETASYDALVSALSCDAEAIYFVTDGAPSGGGIDNPVEIVERVTKLNQQRWMSIYSIGVGVGPAGNPFDNFLGALSTRNMGSYQRVDR